MFPLRPMMLALSAGLAVFVGTMVIGVIGLPLITKKTSAQPIRDNGPKTHLKKTGTPTFGGLFFMLPIMLVAAVAPFVRHYLTPLSVIVVFMGLFGAVGFADDWIKVRVSKKGMSVRQKTLLLGLFSILAACYYLWFAPVEPFILIPLSAQKIVITGSWKFVYCAFLVPFLFYISNSVNITDGLDGLLSSLMAIASIGLFAVLNTLAASIPIAPAAMMLSAVMAGGCLGFLVFNRYPARIFMGDTGSQALGIGFALLTVMAGVPYLAVITGFIFFFEGFSVVLQVIYFKATGGKRIFRMSPIHHHFELVGWHETKVVRVFSLTGLLCAALGFLLMSGPLFGR